MKDLFSSKKEETKKIKEIVDTIQSHSFQCIENLKPTNVKFINQNKFENTQIYEKEINDYLEN